MGCGCLGAGTMAGYVPCVSGSVTISGGGARDAARRRITAFVDSFGRRPFSE